MDTLLHSASFSLAARRGWEEVDPFTCRLAPRLGLLTLTPRTVLYWNEQARNDSAVYVIELSSEPSSTGTQLGVCATAAAPYTRHSAYSDSELTFSSYL